MQEGRCDIDLSSRNLKAEELEAGLEATILAYDGIAVVVNSDNPVSDLTLEQVAAVFTGKTTNWKELGGEDAEIVLIGREAGSGTRDGFESITETEDLCKYRQELTSTGDVIATVSQNPNAIGYASLASVGDTVKALTIGGVEPTENTVKDGIARALAVEPQVLLMDEPTSALDPISTLKIEELAASLKKRYTIVIVTHNMQQAARISDNAAFFLMGELVECGKTGKLFSMPEDSRTEDYITGRFG